MPNKFHVNIMVSWPWRDLAYFLTHFSQSKGLSTYLFICSLWFLALSGNFTQGMVTTEKPPHFVMQTLLHCLFKASPFTSALLINILLWFVFQQRKDDKLIKPVSCISFPGIFPCLCCTTGLTSILYSSAMSMLHQSFTYLLTCHHPPHAFPPITVLCLQPAMVFKIINLDKKRDAQPHAKIFIFLFIL